jgi:hypothetical protein
MSIMNSCVMHKEYKFSTGDINNIHTNTFVNPLTPEKNLTHLNCPTVLCIRLLML